MKSSGAGSDVPKFWKDTLFSAIVLSKAGLGGKTSFDFKYVPQFGQKTVRDFVTSPKRQDKEKWRIEKCLVVTLFVFCALAMPLLGSTYILSRWILGMTFHNFGAPHFVHLSQIASK